MEIVILIIVVIVVIAVASSMAKKRKLERARQRYQETLTSLDRDAGNLELRKTALAAGRAYADLARQQAGEKGRAVFDEVALSNDLAARSVRTGTSSLLQNPEEPAGKSDFKVCPDCAEQVRSAARKCRFCGHEFAG